MTSIIFKYQEIFISYYLPVPIYGINTLVGYFKPENTCEEYESVIVGQDKELLANHTIAFASD